MEERNHVIQSKEASTRKVLDLINEAREGLQKTLEERWDEMTQLERQSLQQNIMDLVASAVKVEEEDRVFYEKMFGLSEDSSNSQGDFEKSRVSDNNEDLSDYFQSDHID